MIVAKIMGATFVAILYNMKMNRPTCKNQPLIDITLCWYSDARISWKDVYVNLKNNVEKIRKQFVYNFSILNDCGDEWDNLLSQAQKYTKKHEINGWENIIVNGIDFNANNPKLNILQIPKKLNYTV